MDMKELKKLTQKLRVLYVEDEDEVRETTVTFLNHFFDDIVVATNGQEGLDANFTNILPPLSLLAFH